MLLCRPNKHKNECILGYLIKLSEYNGFKHLGHLLRYAGLDWKNAKAPVHKIITGEFDLTPYFESLSLFESSSPASNICKLFRKTVDTRNVIVGNPRVCPVCVKEGGYSQYQWAFLPILSCIKHGVMLVDTHPKSLKRLSWYRRQHDFLNDKISIQSLPLLQATNAARHQTATFIRMLGEIQTMRGSPTPLVGLAVNEALTLLNFLTHYSSKLHGERFRPQKLDSLSLAHRYSWGWKLLVDWPDNFFAFLSQFIDRPFVESRKLGMSGQFKDIRDSLHRYKDNEGIKKVQSEFNRFIDEYWPGAIDVKRVTRNSLSESRNIIGKKEAARLLSCRLPRVEQFVAQKKLGAILFNGRTYFKRREVCELIKIKQENWSLSEACKALEISRYQMKKLLDARLVKALQVPNEYNRDWLVDKTDVTELINKLKRHAVLENVSGNQYTYKGITRQGYSIVELIRAMLQGRLKYIVRPKAQHPLSILQFTSFSKTI